MEITKVNALTGKELTLDLDITPEQLERWNNGELIQRVMSNLSADEREFLISGIPPGEFDDLFPGEEDDYDAELDEPAF